jgi:hypothetical protein
MWLLSVAPADASGAEYRYSMVTALHCSILRKDLASRPDDLSRTDLVQTLIDLNLENRMRKRRKAPVTRLLCSRPPPRRELYAAGLQTHKAQNALFPFQLAWYPSLLHWAHPSEQSRMQRSSVPPTVGMEWDFLSTNEPCAEHDTCSILPMSVVLLVLSDLGFWCSKGRPQGSRLVTDTVQQALEDKNNSQITRE